MALPIKQFIESLIHKSKDWKINLLYAWPSIIGSLNDKVHIEKIDDDSLTLAVSHSCWIQELHLLSPLLLKTINEKLDLPRIKHIRFKQAGNKKKKQTKNNTAKKRQSTYSQLTAKDERALTKIIDPALRDTLKMFRFRCYQEQNQ